MARWQLMSGYTKLGLHITDLKIQPATRYVLEFDMLGGEIDLYLLPRGIASGQAGVQHLPAAFQWTPVSLEFSTISSGKSLLGFDNWGIAFLKMILDPKPRSCIYADTYVDNVRLYAKDAPHLSLIDGGDFEADKNEAIYHRNWRPNFLNGSGRELGVDIVTDPLNPENRCLLLPHVIQAPHYPEPMPVEAAGFGWFKQSLYDLHWVSFTGKPVYHLLLVKSGTVEAAIGDTVYTLNEENLLYIPPNTPFRYRCQSGEETEYYWLELTGAHVPALLPAIGLDEISSLPLQDCSALTVFVDAMLFLPATSLTYSLALSGQLQLFLNELERQLSSAQQPSAHRVMIESIAVFIRRYPEKARDNDELANKCGLSTNYFIRLFKKILGTSPQQYRIQFLIKRACTLLQDPDMTIKEIAYSLDMDDPLYFSRLFRSVQGVSPREYRKQWQERWGENHIENN